jgi:peptidoglycan/xylan/chitin deacetylase (PgdA/CDA1 family)
MKTKVLKFMQAAGAFAPFRFAHRGKALVLTYHRFSLGENGPGLPVRVFREQLEYLTSHYQIVPLSYLAMLLNSGRPVPPRTAVITIDDAYCDAYAVAFPLLRARRIPATVFVVTGFTDRTVWIWTDKLRYLASLTSPDVLRESIAGVPAGWESSGRISRADLAAAGNAAMKTLEDHAKDEAIATMARRLGVTLPDTPPAEFAPIDWDQAREMDQSVVEIGSHTATHPILTNVDAGRLERELRESRARLEDELHRRVDLFCYPNGSLNAEVRQAVRRAGYMCAVTSDPGFNDDHSDVFALRRISTEGDLPRFIQSTSGFEHLKIRMLHGATAARRHA